MVIEIKISPQKIRVKGISRHLSPNLFLGRRRKLRPMLWTVQGPRNTSKKGRQGCVENEFLMSTVFPLLSSISTYSYHIQRPELSSQVPPGSINLPQKHVPPLLSHLTPTDWGQNQACLPAHTRLGRAPDWHLSFANSEQSSGGQSSPLSIPISRAPSLSGFLSSSAHNLWPLISHEVKDVA